MDLENGKRRRVDAERRGGGEGGGRGQGRLEMLDSLWNEIIAMGGFKYTLEDTGWGKDPGEEVEGWGKDGRIEVSYNHVCFQI